MQYQLIECFFSEIGDGSGVCHEKVNNCEELTENQKLCNDGINKDEIGMFVYLLIH
jgi:hypothetical protein